MSEKNIPARFTGEIEIYEQNEDDSHLAERLRIKPEERYVIVKLLGEDIALGEIRKRLKISVDRFWAMLHANPVFMNRIQLIRQCVLEEMSDSLVSISYEVADVQRAKLITDNVKWLISKRIPHVYGDKLHVEHNIVDLNSAINEAMLRCKKLDEAVETSVTSTPIESNMTAEEQEEEELKALLK